MFITQFMKSAHSYALSWDLVIVELMKAQVMLTNKHKNSGVIFLSGLAAGYALSMFIPEKFKNESKARLRQIKAAITNPDERAKIADIFKDQKDEAAASYYMAKGRLAKKLHHLEEEYGEISKDKYLEAIEDAVDYTNEYQEIPTPQLNALKKYLQNDFKRFIAALQKEV